MGMQRKPPASPNRPNVEEFICGARADASEAETGKRKCLRLPVEPAATPRILFESRYKRETYYIREDLAREINRRAAVVGKGEKTRIINQALTQYLAMETERKGS